jgi:hypothetical protein
MKWLAKTGLIFLSPRLIDFDNLVETVDGECITTSHGVEHFEGLFEESA